MVILLVVLYVMGIMMFAAYLVTREFLGKQRAKAVSRIERHLHALNVMSYFWVMIAAIMLPLMEFLVVTRPTLFEILNEKLSPLMIFVFFVNTMSGLIAGYSDDPRARNVSAGPIGKQWLWLLAALFAVLGVVGVLTGALV